MSELAATHRTGDRRSVALQRPTSRTAPSPFNEALALQRLVGNRAVTELVARGRGGPIAGRFPLGQLIGDRQEVQRELTTATSPAPPTQSNATAPNTGGAPVTSMAPSTGTSTATAPTGPATSPRELILGAGKEWGRVKAAHLDNAVVMQSLCDYRQAYVDQLLLDIETHFNGEVDGTGKKKYPADLTHRSTGSKALSSDYDITFVGPAVVAAPAVAEFNRRFGVVWGAESGTVFDTNIYAQDFLGPKPAGTHRDDEVTAMSEQGAADEASMQDANALVKARKNMSAESWDAFVDRVVAQLPQSLRATAMTQFAIADATYRTTYVGEMIKKLRETNPEQVDRLIGQGKDEFQIVEELETGKPGIQAANRVYESMLVQVAEIEQRRNALGVTSGPQWEKLTLDLREAKSKAMLFANEPYFAAGTLYHVVGNVQANYGLTLGTTEYFQSANENFGDFKKEVAHQKHKRGVTFPQFAFESSKYCFRFLQAASFLKKGGVALPETIDTDLTTETELLNIRQKTAPKDQKVAEATPIASRLGTDSIDGLDTKVTELAITVNASARTSGHDRRNEGNTGSF